MHYQTVAALLFTLAVSLSYSQPIFNGTRMVSPNAPYNATWPATKLNLKTTATLTITYTRNVTVCIV
jgi:hypothetical protein